MEKNCDFQVIWQSWQNYITNTSKISPLNRSGAQIIYILHEFILRMDLAYAAADLIISRAGAIAISEISAVGKASRSLCAYPLCSRRPSN
jgi:UDP-N-acetylglucosamine--N-acetylmuramyl-(pentapeptide) pyrophosphoryl-undecaprenol N-acetylglucosamine transferase